MNYGATGTIFGNNSTPQGRIKYSYTIGPATINAAISKVIDKSFTAKNTVLYMDADNDVYHLEGVYAWKDGKAGINVNYYRLATNRPLAAPTPALAAYSKTTYYLPTAYAIAKIGPVAVQAEINYAFGDIYNYDTATADVQMENWSGWIDATADFGMVYFGGTFAYVSGDDPGTLNKQEGGTLNGGIDWTPTLIMFNQDRNYWVGAITGYISSGTTATSNAGTMTNAWFGQGRVGVKPIPALDIMASISYATADKRPTGVLNSTYGWEVDVTGTYKITNNLSYMLGVGYWSVGDYYRGSSNANQLTDDFMLINKLTLTF